VSELATLTSALATARIVFNVECTPFFGAPLQFSSVVLVYDVMQIDVDVHLVSPLLVNASWLIPWPD